MRPVPTLTAAAVVTAAAVTGCADVRAINEARDDRRDFALSSKQLVIESDGAELRLVAGTGAAVEVERSLTGKATLRGNASWSLDGDRLRLRVTCSGLVPDCTGRHIVHVPAGVAVRVTNNAAVRVVGLSADLTATVTDGWLRVEKPAGTLRLDAEYDIDVTGARSPDVIATSSGRNVDLVFAAPPNRVEVRADGSAKVALPGGAETYRIVATPGGSALTSDPASRRTVTVTAGEGYTATVRKVS
ncbi:hypothetical protein ACGF5C_20770 [Micromonospora sp. NPDC047620]|uniref:hypothetical protein n=1 Tax=Micromonospora sp. NPDC047620 TaxID=3364251 RepID=UPI00371C89D5